MSMEGRWKTRSGQTVTILKFEGYSAVVGSRILYFNNNGDCSDKDFDLMRRLPDDEGTYTIKGE